VTRIWRLLEWGFTMALLCWLFVRMWTDMPFARRRRPRLLDRFRRRSLGADATEKTPPAVSKGPAL